MSIAPQPGSADHLAEFAAELADRIIGGAAAADRAALDQRVGVGRNRTNRKLQ
jgi:hypothetical protein